MAIKTIDVLDSPGIVKDLPAHRLKDGAFTDGGNVAFGAEGAGVLSGDLTTFSAAPITPLWISAFPPLSLPIWAYGDLANVYAYDGSSHTDITRTASNYSGLASERWQATVFNGVGILNNAINVPQAWTDFQPTTPLVDLANWDSNRRAKVIRSFKNFLVALNMTDSGTRRPYRILWSDSADAGTLPGSWDSTDPATDSREFDLAQTPDHLVDCLPIGGINIIYKETSTWAMQYVGPPHYFSFDTKIFSKHGLLARDCVVATPIGHIVVTQNDIIIHTGQVEQQQSIVNRALRKWIFSSIDPDSYYNSFTFADTRRNEFWFCFPEVGETYATKAIIWNWEEQTLGIRDMSPTPFISVGPVGESTLEDPEWG